MNFLKKLNEMEISQIWEIQKNRCNVTVHNTESDFYKITNNESHGKEKR